jgi:hypothetical protein
MGNLAADFRELIVRIKDLKCDPLSLLSRIEFKNCMEVKDYSGSIILVGLKPKLDFMGHAGKLALQVEIGKDD